MPPFGNKSPNEQPKKEFTPETILLGEKFLEARKKISLSLSYTERLDKAAHALSPTEYPNGHKDLPSEVRSWIATEDAKRKKERAAETKIIENEAFKARIAANVEQLKEDWSERFDTNPDFQRAMTHPEDGAIPPEGLK